MIWTATSSQDDFIKRNNIENLSISIIVKTIKASRDESTIEVAILPNINENASGHRSDKTTQDGEVDGRKKELAGYSGNGNDDVPTPPVESKSNSIKRYCINLQSSTVHSLS
ncbi:hypothetical protein F442_19766 [Phytophthora nicotianae P10297]|uniref:Uncharacterized protein n=2 Tax=Phytophthora nicotianae TaxID=4792 RepID=V9E2P1_PHYNI|nr:hypothetical protein F443_19964 [Phytophthora nicotianae P1569]ETP31364.1 hypothetical protein F442_19766 [Phytophthora nicotianae P10297]